MSVSVVRRTDRASAPQPSPPFRQLLIVLTAALLLRVGFALLTANTYDYDEFVLLLNGRDYAHGAAPYRDFMFFHPPGMLVLLRAVEPLTALWWPLARGMMLVIDSATAGLIWYLGRRLYGSRGGLAAGLLYALNPLALIAAVRVGQDSLVTALGLGGLVLLLGNRSWKSAVLAGACLALALWIKYPAIYFLPVYILVAPRRTAAMALGLVFAGAALFLPYHAEIHALWSQTIQFQRTRWSMDFGTRIETTALFWLAVNPLALPALPRRPPLWVAAGFALGGLFVLTSQVYYHYFVLVVPFAALLGAPVALYFSRLPKPVLVALIGSVMLGWALIIDLGGQSPLFVTAARLSDIQPTIRLVDCTTQANAPILTDRDEYPYLANRQEVAHYFWNVGVLVDAKYLEQRLPHAQAVVLSYGASSGYPAGLVAYLNTHYRRIDTRANTVWLPPMSGLMHCSS
ncbi:MAG: glycosyltransferase family 39 protein [Chloroflexota bacterium]|nr:glycosyltransferase family 39 protein [Chloroflexota bacterium]